MSLSGPSSAFDSETFGQDASFHLEQPIGSMTISPSGRDVALASKEGLHIIDLDSPYSPPRHLPHRTPWEVADVQWSPFASRDYWVVSTSNQKALVWNLDAKSWQDSIQHVLHGHRRAITDINFSAHNPDVLATCAVDSFVHCWDLRASGRPSISFSDWFAAATQVKWCRQDEHVLASSHDKFLHIWDTRHGAIPLKTIEAHNTKIYGLDWNRFQRNKIVTCSLDRTVKFWNTADSTDEPERVIETPFPVWRARHTPFGWGMVAMPQRGSGNLYLYDRRPIDGHYENGQVRPVTTFAGHNGQVKEFLWRARGGFQDDVDHREFQLISWGTDRELRLHRVDPEALEAIGYEKGVSKREKLNYTRRGARYVTFRDLPEDIVSPAETPSRGESLPSQQQLSAFRKRNSTTVGMSKVPIAQIKGWVSSQRRASRVAMHGKATAMADVNPIAWLKNVKIASWDPDALAEEIRHVGEKFKRVRFEAVDIKHRKLVMSLQAPWSEHQDAVYLRVDIRFPQSYPRHANAVVTLQKTSALPEDLHTTLTSELHTIAEIHMTQQRGCLEAILRYLLREQSLEQVIAYARGDSLTESKLIARGDAAEESSDSDDDQIVGLGQAVASAANVRVPLAKGCGAVWSETGRLVCFFPPKPTESASALAGLSMHTLDRSETGRLFEGFGKLNVNSPGRKVPDKSRTTNDEDSDSGSSDSITGSSSSSSSSSSESEADLPSVYAPYHKRLLAFPQRTKSIDFSNRSTTLAGAKVIANENTRQTIVSIRDYADLIPSRKDLAERYRIIGDGPGVCKHNSKVAKAVGRHDLSSVWSLASMILDHSVPLEAVKAAGSDDDFVLIARRAMSRLRRKDSGIDLPEKPHKSYGQTRWGGSPLASSYLVPAMFDYYERIADVQMLAMLSCIFSEFRSSMPAPVTTSNAQAYGYFPSVEVADALLRPQPSLVDLNVQRPPMNRLLSSLEDQALLRSRRGTTMSLDPATASLRFEPDTRLWTRAQSAAADDYERASNNVSLSTSPEGGRTIQRLAVSSAAQASLSALTQSYSHSPPTQPHSGSNIASSLKKYSPSGSLTPGWGLWSAGHGTRATRASLHYTESSSQDKEASLRPSASLANIRSLRRSGHTTPEVTRRDVRSFAPSETSETTRRTATKGQGRTVSTFLRNQSHFDMDSYVTLPLLDRDAKWKYQSFRAAYASMLEAWDLPIQRAEILRANAFPERSLQSTASSPIKQGRAKSLIPEQNHVEPGLSIRRCCPRCGNPLAAIEKNGIAIGWHCISALCLIDPQKPSRRSVCAICTKGAQLAVPCLECQHLVCLDCGNGWYGKVPTSSRQQERSSVSTIATTAGSATDFVQQSHDVDTEIPTCPTGCGCPCPSLNPSQIHVPEPMSSTMTTAPTSAVSEKFLLVPPRMARTESQASTKSQDSHRTTVTSATTTASEGALDAFFSLTGVRSRAGSKAERGGARGSINQGKSRGKGKSTTGTGLTRSDSDSVRGSVGGKQDADGEREQKEAEIERALNPWANSKFASLGRGVGGGLSRPLKEKGSDSTIRGSK